MTEFRDFKNLKDEAEEEAQYFCKFTFGQFFTILVLEVVTLAFIFYLGAKYGTSYLKIGEEEKSNITEVIAGTQPELQDKELQAMARDVVQGGSEADLKNRVKEILDKQQAPLSTPPPASAPATTPAPAPVEQPQSDQAALSPTATPSDVVSPPEETSGAIRMKSPTSSQYSIQVGSYPNMGEASTKVEEWRGKGYPSFMMIADIPDRGRWYRVRIGGFATKDDAMVYLDKFRLNEGVEAIVVLNEQ